MKRSPSASLLSVLLSLCLSGAAAPARDDRKKGAKTHPDLSGTWVLDLKKSRWEGRKTARARSPVRLVIRRSGTEVRVTRTALVNGEEHTTELTYYADGRGEKNPFPHTGDRLKLSGTVESAARWEDGRLVIRGTKLLRARGDLNRIDFTEEWELSADGMTLTQTTTHDDPRRPARLGDYSSVALPDTKYVFARAQ